MLSTLYSFSKEETCQNYEAVNGECKPMGICETCEPGDTPDTFLPGKCAPVANYSRWFVQEYGLVNAGKDTDVTGRKLRAADKIKAEILARGPVSCGMHVSKEFVQYRGGIFKQFTPLAWLLDHEVSLVGWGKENGEEFWCAPPAPTAPRKALVYRIWRAGAWRAVCGV